jgi:hypothetical protein
VAGLRTLIQTRHGPDWYVLSIRFDTMPSAPSRHAWANTVAPSSAMCSFSRMPALVLRSSRARSVDGQVDLDYAPSGVTWRLTCPAAKALEPIA